MKEKYVITIGRQFGSGGREIGRLIAEKLGIEYYDKELLAEAAKEAGVNTEFFEESDERSPNFFAKSNLWAFNVGYSPTTSFTKLKAKSSRSLPTNRLA